MLIEAEAIPYEAALLRGERLLVLAPHPDDEVIGCGGLVAQHLREGRRVRIVVATDGAQAGNAAVREEESRRGVAMLGDAELEFLRYPDRQLGDDAAARIREQLVAFRPDLIAVPGAVEIHPDHLALSRVFCELVQRDQTLFSDLATARVAFYEVSQPLRPNAIVDISDVAETKYAAIAAHTSQLELRDYVAYARGLNTYRAMTLPPDVRFAEAYYVTPLQSLRTTPLSALQREMGTARPAEVTRETLPISVVIRTRDRQNLLREAIDSVRANDYPCEIVVVNDGGATPSIDGVKYVEHPTSRGRAEAANSGVRAAANKFIAFLDDDDLFYPEHLPTLARAAQSSHLAWYTDAVSAALRPGPEGDYRTQWRTRIYEQDFDRELLLIDNYIPLPTLLVGRETFLDAGGFDASFDLFEDWDFLIRLSRRGDFLRIPRVTCEIRHFEGGSSVVLAAPEGSEQFRRAKLRVWERHRDLLDENVFANVFERQKRRVVSLASDVATIRGELDQAQHEIDRASRAAVDLQNVINGQMLLAREQEGAVHVASALAERKTIEAERAARENDHLRSRLHDSEEMLGRMQNEVERLNGLLEMIYRSKTWKLHTIVEKARGRG